MSTPEWSSVVEELRQLGLVLTVTRLADGTLRLNQWRTIQYWPNAREADKRWSAVAGDDGDRLDKLKEFLLNPKKPLPIPSTQLGSAPAPGRGYPVPTTHS